MRTLFIVWALVIILAIVGWVGNITELVGMVGESSVTTEFVVRVVGIPFAPVGVFMFYLF